MDKSNQALSRIERLGRLFMRLANLAVPRRCAMCGCRLAIGEHTICSACDMDLPRTHYQENPYGNDMAKLLWGRMPVERAAALFFYKPHSASSRIIHNLKYSGHPETGELMGRMAAAEFADHGFFDGVDAIVPVPLARKRIRERGYNQAFEIARGISAVTRMPIIDKAVIRESFKGSQTKMNRWQRNENVEGVFSLVDGSALTGKHTLIIDDVVTTGATVVSCARELMKAGDVRFSVMSLGFTKG